MQIQYDWNTNSWCEVWKSRLKVSWGTDGPAGLFLWVTMVMWIWPYLCLVFLPPYTPTTHTTRTTPNPYRHKCPCLYMRMCSRRYLLKHALPSHQQEAHTLIVACPRAYAHTYLQQNQPAPAVFGVAVTSSRSTGFQNPGEVSRVAH